MLTYCDGRLYLGKVSFALPNNCKIVTDPDLIPLCGVVICSPDESFYLDIDFSSARTSAEYDLNHYMENDPKTPKATPFIAPNAKGWERTLSLAPCLDHEIAFDVETGVHDAAGPVNLFSIIITPKGSTTISDVKKSKIFQDLVDSICV